MGPVYSLINLFNFVVGHRDGKMEHEQVREEYEEKQLQKKKSMEEMMQKQERELAKKMTEKRIEN